MPPTESGVLTFGVGSGEFESLDGEPWLGPELTVVLPEPLAETVALPVPAGAEGELGDAVAVASAPEASPDPAPAPG